MVTKLITKNEIYLGTQLDQNKTANYLESLRASTIKGFDNEIKLVDLLDSNYIITDLYLEVINKFKETIGELYNIELLDPSRYIILLPESNIGGFYGIPVGGFDHYQALGKTTLLNSEIIKSDFIITMELIRNYLHDCIHYFTYKSYYWNEEKCQAVRYQYGLNFRNIHGISYSSPNLSIKYPIGINLNLLMDGLTQYFVSLFIKSNINYRKSLNHLMEFAIFEEIFYLNLLKDYKSPVKYYKEVLHPTIEFLKYWGNDYLMNDILLAMLSGNLESLKIYFSSKLNRKDAWEILFKQELFDETDLSMK
ncbi:MAG: hypothetical protein IPO78_10145 [Saprospiraceae bacterium]|nr:hypothetical protein [Saprospiraceae bacterium]